MNEDEIIEAARLFDLAAIWRSVASALCGMALGLVGGAVLIGSVEVAWGALGVSLLAVLVTGYSTWYSRRARDIVRGSS